MPEWTSVSAPARLHFGLFSIGQQTDFQFGGAGLMIDGPRTVVEVESAPALQVDVRLPESDSLAGGSAAAEELQATISRILDRWWQGSRHDIDVTDTLAELPIRLTLRSLPPRHAGFGSGTQLAFAVVVAVQQHLERPLPNIEELAAMTGRGRRSAIGTYGFWRGGLLVDRGKSPRQTLAPLDFQTPFPNSWPIVTVVPAANTGLSGTRESAAFHRLPASSPEAREAMIALVRERMIPGVLEQDYATFASALWEFGQRSGRLFESIQQGVFNGPVVEQMAMDIRRRGIPAVAQSSWGPGLFAICPSLTAANCLVDELRTVVDPEVVLTVRSADNRGVRIHQTFESSVQPSQPAVDPS